MRPAPHRQNKSLDDLIIRLPMFSNQGGEFKCQVPDDYVVF